MSLSLTPPQTLRKIDANLLSLLDSDDRVNREDIDATDTAVRPLYDELARIAGVDLANDWEMIGRSHDLSPDEAQGAMRGWHRDLSEAFTVTDKLPTEFLVAEEDIVKNFWRKCVPAEAGPLGAQLTPKNVKRLSLHANKLSVENLHDFGFAIWSAQPLEVVAVGPTNIHRATPNSAERVIHRNFASIFKVLWAELLESGGGY